MTAAPTNLSGQVRLSWLLPASNGGSAITDYIIQRSPNGTSGWVTINDGVRTTTTYTVTGLANGTRYYFRVLARNAAGTRGGEQRHQRDPPHQAVSARPAGDTWQRTGDTGVDATDVQRWISDHPLRAPTLDQPDHRVGQPEHHDPGDDKIVHGHRPAQRHPLLLPHRRGQRRRHGTMERCRQRRAGRTSSATASAIKL